MRSIDRLRGTLTGTPIDHLAAQPMLMMFAASHSGIAYIDYTKDGRKAAEAQLKVVEDFGVDCVLMCSDPAREVVDIAGEGSVKWLVDQGPVILEERAALLDKGRLNELKVPDPYAGGRMHDRINSEEICFAQLKGETSIVGWVEGPLALAQELRGLNNIMRDFLDDPAFVHDLMAFTSEVAIVYAAAQVNAGVDTIGMSDAAASMIGPRHYGNFVLPYQEKVFRAVRERCPGTVLRQHMCGNVNRLVPQMATLPVDIYEVDFGTDLAAAREAFGPDRVLLGNVSTVTDLLSRDPRDVEAATANCHRIAGPRHIVGAGCEVSPLTPPANLQAMMNFAREHKPGELLSSS
ncbi:MAG TPA: uroporphyrinogen decarboxylase family protein [Acidimicrobiales bacterium]|nr:uroporphyrinogen decarboxylase family protein [Acidimicrobiales bacterium]